MSAAEKFSGDDQTVSVGLLQSAPDAIEVRRNAGLSALVGAVSSAVAIAWLGRASQSGSALDWVGFALTAVIGAYWLHAFVDARTPLLVADAQGVRLRLGASWTGLPWGALREVVHTPRRGLLRDGRVVLEPLDEELLLTELDSSARRHLALNRRLHGAALAVPLSLATRVPHLDEDLTTSLRQLAGSSTRVLEEASAPTVAATAAPVAPVVASPAGPDPVGVDLIAGAAGDLDRDGDVAADHASADGPITDHETVDERAGRASWLQVLRARTAGRIAGARTRRDDVADEEWDDAVDHDHDLADHDSADDDLADRDTADAYEDGSDRSAVAYENPAGDEPEPLAPARELRVARRAEVHSEITPIHDEHPLEGRELRRAGSVPLVEEAPAWSGDARPLPRLGDTVEPLVIDDLGVEPAHDPVIGPALAAARARLGLTVDALADRTRIRPHVIEAIEVDDFVPCGGDFYARGHLRTLSRVLGVDVQPLLATYDERYADAPIDARRVFEAELATGTGGIRSTRGGPNWSVLVAAVMAVILAWSIARLAMDTDRELEGPASLSSGSGEPNQGAVSPQNVTAKITAIGSTTIKVTGAKGRIVFAGPVEPGDVHRFDVTPPFKVSAEDGALVTVQVDGDERGKVGGAGKKATKTYRVSD